MNTFDNINPIDYRYYGWNKDAMAALQPYLSETAMISYMAKVEAALALALADNKICNRVIAKQIAAASGNVTAEEVYKEEDRIKHNVRALANSIRKRVGKAARPFVHFTATSHDIICTADAARLKDATEKVLIPAANELEKILIKIAEREKSTVQIGRTHGQHAEPITFGFAMAEYVDRLGTRIVTMQRAASEMRGKMSGAVGAYNASSLFMKDAEKFEKDVLKKMGLTPGMHSTQVAEPEYVLDLMHSVISMFGVLANLADDMRNLQRSEIAEVGEAFEKAQVGSSTMPHKRNPINFENVKSLFKVYMPRMTTLYLDQISEHQRDLTNSASSRYNAEMLAGLYVSIKRLSKVMDRLVVDKKSMSSNFKKSSDLISAEPLYILLARHDHPDAHEHVRKLAQQARNTGKSLSAVIAHDKSISKYTKHFTKEQLAILSDPTKYAGLASKKTSDICRHWKKELSL